MPVFTSPRSWTLPVVIQLSPPLRASQPSFPSLFKHSFMPFYFSSRILCFIFFFSVSAICQNPCFQSPFLLLASMAPKGTSWFPSHNLHTRNKVGSSIVSKHLSQSNPPYFEGYEWSATTTSNDIKGLRDSYGIPESVVLEVSGP